MNAVGLHELAVQRNVLENEFDERRVEALRETCRQTLDNQRDFVQGIAVEELQAQRERVSTYLVQARFALASVYDRAAATAGAPAPAQESIVAEGGQ